MGTLRPGTALLLSLAASLTATPVRAQPSEPGSTSRTAFDQLPTALARQPIPTREEQLEASLRTIDRRFHAAGVGLGLSVPAIVISGALFARGTIRTFCISFGDPCPSDPGGTAMQLVSPFLFVAGVVGTGVSASALRRLKKERREIEAELRKTSWQLGPTGFSILRRF